MTNNKTLYTGFLFGAAAAFIWGGFPVVTRHGVQQTLTPYDITALRFLFAGIVLLPWFWRQGLKGMSYTAALVLTCGAGAPYLLLAAGGLTFAPASHFGVITPSSMLIFSSLGSWWWLGERVSTRRLFGIAVIIVGIVVIGWEGLTGGGEQVWLGDVMFVAAGLFWACYTLASRYWSVAPLQAITVVSVFSLLLYVPVYFVCAEPRISSAPLTEVLVQVLFQGLFSALLALLLYTRAVQILGAARGAVFGALVPCCALLLAFLVLGDIPTRFQWIGVAMVTAGMVWSLGPYHPGRIKANKETGS